MIDNEDIWGAGWGNGGGFGFGTADGDSDGWGGGFGGGTGQGQGYELGGGEAHDRMEDGRTFNYGARISEGFQQRDATPETLPLTQAPQQQGAQPILRKFSFTTQKEEDL